MLYGPTQYLPEGGVLLYLEYLSTLNQLGFSTFRPQPFAESKRIERALSAWSTLCQKHLFKLPEVVFHLCLGIHRRDFAAHRGLRHSVVVCPIWTRHLGRCNTILLYDDNSLSAVIKRWGIPETKHTLNANSGPDPGRDA
jgi:hypothetical protein